MKKFVPDVEKVDIFVDLFWIFGTRKDNSNIEDCIENFFGEMLE